MKNVKRLLALLSNEEKRKLLLVCAGVLVLGILELAGIGSIMPFLSVASNPDVIRTNAYLHRAYEMLGFGSGESFLFALGVGALLFIFVSNAMKALITYMNKRFATMRLHHLSLRLFRRYLYRPYAFFLDKNTSELLKNTLGEVETLVSYALMPLLDLITSAATAALIVVMLVLVDPLLALLSFLVIGSIYGAIYVVVRRRLERFGRRRLQANRLRYKKVSEAFAGIKDVKILGREDHFVEEYIPASRENARVQVASDLIGSIPRNVLEVVTFGGILLVVLYMMRTMGDFGQAVPVIGLYAFAAYRMIPSLQSIFQDLARMRTNLAVAELIHQNLGDWRAEEARAKSLRQLNARPLPFNRVLRLEAVRFGYSGGESPVIKDQTLEILKNTTVGLVGPTGCGKTTLADIILGLLEPQSGRMTVDDVEVTGENIESWRRQIGYVPQHIYLTDDSVARNIAFGLPERLIDMEAVEKAARVANIHDFVTDEMPLKYKTIVGERGIRLSGGQVQRIGIARALYHDPAVLVLDEATSFLDGLTEAAVMDAIHALSHRKTIIMIAHRLSTVRECDEIFAMDQGVVTDRGRYQELVVRNERFRKIAAKSH